SDSLHFDAVLDTVRLTGVATGLDGEPLPDPVLTWHSLDPNVSTVDAAGLVRARGNGHTGIVASIAGIADTVPVGVRQVAVAFEAPPARDSIVINEVRQLVATAFDRNGQPIPDAPFVWTSLDPGTVAVDELGRVRGLAIGTTDIEVRLAEFEASTSVRVEESATLVIEAEAVPSEGVPRSVMGTRLELLALSISVDGIEPVRLSGVGFDLRGNDLDADRKSVV